MRMPVFFVYPELEYRRGQGGWRESEAEDEWEEEGQN